MSFDIPREELEVQLERAFLVSVALPDRPFVGDDPLDELRGPAESAGAKVVGGQPVELHRQGQAGGAHIHLAR